MIDRRGDDEAADDGTARAEALSGERELRPAERRERDRGWSNKREAERAILVGVVLPPSSRDQADEHLDELALLATTAGALPVAATTVTLADSVLHPVWLHAAIQISFVPGTE